VNNEGARRRLFFSQKGPPAFRRSPRTLRGATFCSCRRIFVSRRKIDSASCCPLPFFFDSGRLNYGAKDNRAHPHQFYNRAFRNCSTYRKRGASWSPLSSARHFKLRARDGPLFSKLCSRNDDLVPASPCSLKNLLRFYRPLSLSRSLIIDQSS